MTAPTTDHDFPMAVRRIKNTFGDQLYEGDNHRPHEADNEPEYAFMDGFMAGLGAALADPVWATTLAQQVDWGVLADGREYIADNPLTGAPLACNCPNCGGSGR